MDLNLISYTITSLGRGKGPESDNIVSLGSCYVLNVKNPKPSVSIRA